MSSGRRLTAAEKSDRIVKALQEMLAYLADCGVIRKNQTRAEALAKALAPIIMFASK